MKKHILFVDDEPNLLSGLQRMLRPMRREWEMHFAASGPEALDLLDDISCDVVVSDMRMPIMDGAAFLTEVRQRHPTAVRLILSGHSDRAMIMRAVGPAHQFLAKPCDADMIKSTVSRACTLRTLLPDNSLTEMITSIETLPSPPDVYRQVMEAAQTPEGSLASMGQMIASDLSMTATTLKLVQSAFFGLQRHLSNPTQAVDLLGLDTMQALVLTADIFSYADATTLGGVSLHHLWDHSLQVGTCAQTIMRGETDNAILIDDTLTAGFLHDVGTLILATHLPEPYTQAHTQAQTTEIAMCTAERNVLGATHAEVGAYLMGLWGFPDAIVEALAYHHNPAEAPSQLWSPLSAVHVAEGLVHELEPIDNSHEAPQLDPAYLEHLGCLDRLPVWREQCQQALHAHRAHRDAKPRYEHQYEPRYEG